MNDDTNVFYGKLVMSSYTELNKKVNENLGDIDASALVNQDSDAKIAFATQIDSFTRQLNGLTTTTYDTSKVTIELDINEILAE